MTVRFCRSCGATSAETAFPRKERGQLAPKLCLDCEAEAVRDNVRRRWPSIVTRASYRAAHRRRAQSDQGDLIDLLVPPP